MQQEKETKKETKFHSEREEALIKDIQRTDLKETDKELSKRVVPQYKDSMVNVDCFNAFAKNVLIRDENGKRIVINNHDQIKLQKLKNAGKLNPVIDHHIDSENNEVIDVDDDVEFDD